MDLDPRTDLSFTRRLAVPRSMVWDCWTLPEHIPHFFVPRPHRVTACDIDLRVGGRFNTTFEVEGNEMQNNGVYLEVPAPDPFMTAILLLADSEDGGTTYTAIARHRSPETRQAHEDMGFFDGWGTVVTQLEDYAKGLLK